MSTAAGCRAVSSANCRNRHKPAWVSECACLLLRCRCSGDAVDGSRVPDGADQVCFDLWYKAIKVTGLGLIDRNDPAYVLCVLVVLPASAVEHEEEVTTAQSCPKELQHVLKSMASCVLRRVWHGGRCCMSSMAPCAHSGVVQGGAPHYTPGVYSEVTSGQHLSGCNMNLNHSLFNVEKTHV
jgi:hypothetical protein